MNDQDRLRFGILGPLEVIGPHGRIDAGGPRQRAVLALLLINANRPLTSDQIIDVVWGEDPPPGSLATLQAYISKLRRVLEPDRAPRAEARVLVKNGGGYQLTVQPEQVDALHFEQLLERGAQLRDSDPRRCHDLLAEALTLWRGPPLADFRYSEFAQAEIARLDELHVSAQELRIAAGLAAGLGEALIPELERLVEANPFRERLWGHLMRALYRTGRQAEALRAYARCAELLAELGLVPGEELRDLETAIFEQDLPTAAPEVQAPTTDDGWIGRRRERESVRSILTETRTGAGSLILIEGEAGVGKTRFLETLQSDGIHLGFRTAFARCVEVGPTPPFWPWIQLTRRLGGDLIASAAGPYAPYLAALLPESDGTLPAAPVHRVAEGLAVALRKLAETQPVLLFIDDLDSADPDSLSVLALLAAEIGDAAVAIACSRRGQDIKPVPELATMLAELARFDLVRRFSLPRLDRNEVRQLAESLAGCAVDDATVGSIYTRSEGNAFFTVELTRLLIAEDSLSPDRAASAVPATVLEVLERRLSRLSSDTQRLIRSAAVCGRQFDLVVAAESTGVDMNDAVGLIDEAIGSGLIGETDRLGVYRFSHMIVVTTVTHGLGALRRAQLHQEIAQILQDRFGDDPTRLVEIAHHWQGAVGVAGTGRAIEALARAGAHAFDVNALELAEELFNRRLELVETQTPRKGRDALEIAALLDLGRVWTWRYGYHSTLLRQAADRLWELTGIQRGAVDFTDGPIDHRHPILSSFQARFSVEIVSGDVARACSVAEKLLDVAQGQQHPMVVYAANQCALTAFVQAGRVDDARPVEQAAGSALEELDPHRNQLPLLPLGQQPAWITFYAFSAWLRWLIGDFARADELLAENRREAERTPAPQIVGFAATIEGIVRAMHSNPGALLEAQTWARSVASGEISGLVDTWMNVQSAWAQGMTGGDPRAAAAEIAARLGDLSRDGAEVAHSFYWGLAAQVALRADDPDLAVDMTGRGIARALTGSEHFWYPELERLRAQALRKLRQYDESAAAMQRAGDVAHDLGLVPLIGRIEEVPTT